LLSDDVLAWETDTEAQVNAARRRPSSRSRRLPRAGTTAWTAGPPPSRNRVGAL